MSILLSAFLLFSLLLGDTCLLQDPPILKLMRMGIGPGYPLFVFQFLPVCSMIVASAPDNVPVRFSSAQTRHRVLDVGSSRVPGSVCLAPRGDGSPLPKRPDGCQSPARRLSYVACPLQS